MSEPLEDDHTDDDDVKKTDFVNISGSLVSRINYKVAIFLFFIGMLIFNNVFVKEILGKIPGAVSETDSTDATTKGTLIQLVMLSMLYVVLDLLVQYEVI